MHWLKIFFTGSLGGKFLMAMSGAALSFFLFAHLGGNLQALSGREAFLAYAAQLHRLGWGLHVLEIFLVIAFLGHNVLGLSLFLKNCRARQCRYAVANSEASRLARFMPYTGLLILFFLFIHLGQFHYGKGEQNLACQIRGVLSRPAWAFFYLGGLAMLCLHAGQGFQSMFLTFGISHRKYNRLIQAGALIAGIGLGLGFALIPLFAFFWKDFLA